MSFTLDKKIYICIGSTCKHSRKKPVLEELIFKNFEKEDVGRFNCLNRCEHEGAFFFNQKAHYYTTDEDFYKIINQK